ncbi:bifunctional metallophosphatase/5'-nucleotidase [Georgenia alba]|uniref:Bifunctional metallophosphatase/5'-nucleotidase n=1 Tax=Georgenia alba TaxID=2233858 RepID=A0ABW2QF62_9MICO
MPRSSARRRAPMLRPAAALGVLSLSAVGLGALPAAAIEEDDGTVTIDILDVADFHGALVQAPGLADLVSGFTAENPDTVFVSAGDNIGGSTFESAIQDDEPTIDVLNQMGLATSAVGNHEFDRGYEDLVGRVADRADFEYTGANVQGGSPELPAFSVWEAPAGVSVGFVGAVTTSTPEAVSPDGIAGLTFSDEAEAVNETAAELSDGNPDNGEADVVVALVHEAAYDSLTGGLSDDVDALFTGHSHLEVNDTIGGRPVLQTVNGGEQLAHLRINYDPETDEVSTVTQEILPVGTYEPGTRELTRPDGSVVDVGTLDPAVGQVADTVDAAFAEAEELGAQQVGTVTASFNRGTNDGTNTGGNRGTESTLGNLLADAYVWKAEDLGQDVDLGVMNPGGLRADLDPNGDGVVTYSELATVSPFGNTLTVADLTGAQLVTMLEQQWLQPSEEDHSSLRLGLSSGVQYYYDPTAEPGSRVLGLEIDGEPVDPEATYRVATINFLAAGGDSFDVFTEASAVNDTGYVDRDATVDYLAANQELTPDYTQRSIGVTFLSDPAAEYQGGEEVALDLSSLSFTSDEPKPEEVTLLMDGEEIGRYPVDNTVTAGTDETGQASVTFTVPDLSAYEDGDVITFELVFGATEESVQTIPFTLEVTGQGATPAPPTGDPGEEPGDDPGEAPIDQLPETGTEPEELAAVAAALILLGTAGILLARRRTVTA